MTKEEAQADLQKTIDKINKQRERVFELIDEAAYDAAIELRSTLTEWKPSEDIDCKTKKIRNDAANDLLDMAGYKVRKVEHSGAVFITGEHEKKILDAAKL